jgi:tetratricopeptide (TPR) repeat protein
MPLTEFFADQFRQVRDFMLDPAQVVRVVHVDPDLKPVLVKALAKMDDEPDNPHAMLYADAPFETPEQYFTALLDQLRQEYEKNAAPLQARGARFVVPYDERQALHPAVRFCMYASALAEALPSSMGSLVFVLDPGEVAHAGSFRECVAYVAAQAESTWLKLIVLDPRLEPRLAGLEAETPRVGAQTFYLPPEEIERGLREQAQRPDPGDPESHRRNLGVLAGFAFSRRDYDEAARLQSEWAALAESAGAPAEAAGAHYNLGNTRLEQGALPEAEAHFVRACELCLDHSLDGVLPLALTNLGVALFRQGRADEALQSLQVAHDRFRGQNHRPGQAFVLDTLAGMYFAGQQHDLAERAWLAALDVYQGISAGPFADVRDSGTRDIQDKLERFYRATGRSRPGEPAPSPLLVA